MPKEVLTYDDSGYWNEQKRWRTAKGGKLMAFTVLGNVPVWYYRTDVLKDAGITPPKTIPEVLASCAKLSKPPSTYGAVLRGERGNPVRYEWQQWMLSKTAAVIGNWNYAIPKGITPAKRKAALAFAKWFMSYDAQYAFAKAGGIPNRSDVLASDLTKDPNFSWMPAYLESLKTARQELGYAEGAQVEQVLGLRLNQALIGEMSSGKALNLAAQDIKDLFEKNKRKTGLGPPLPE
jgi:ABC-type glycerol-3-phosphate transport system substrate-binding protein